MGAGKIGRGFAAEVFKEAGYRLIFIDNNAELVNLLNKINKYAIYKIPSADRQKQIMINDYQAFLDKDTESLAGILAEIDLIVVCVFSNAFTVAGEFIARCIKIRAEQQPQETLDIIVMANTLHAGKLLYKEIQKKLSGKYRRYFDNKVGIPESIVLRMALDPSADLIKKKPLAVVTNGYDKLIVDGTAFKGEKPLCSLLEYTERFEACEKRKLYTYNMVHALFAYAGVHKGLKFVYECIEDREIMDFASGALDEVSQALQAEFGFSRAEMDEWISQCIQNMTNPILRDHLQRVGADPVRKLKFGDRLAGPALLCKKNGILPYWTTKAIAYAFLYNNEDDDSSMLLQQQLKKKGINKVAEEYCGFEQEPELVYLIADRYNHVWDYPEGGLREDQNRIKLFKHAWESGFYFEKNYKGCAQCLLLGCKSALGVFNNKVFESATSFSGGMGLCIDGSCGAYTGGQMTIGLLTSRNEEDLKTKNKVGQYKAYELVQLLHDKFCECYGSIICKDIHNRIFGRSFLIRKNEIKEDFEEAGAHLDKCTTVIGMGMYLLTDILIREALISPKDLL